MNFGIIQCMFEFAKLLTMKASIEECPSFAEISETLAETAVTGEVSRRRMVV